MPTRYNFPHMDANENAHLARQLEYIATKTYDVEYPAMIARTLIPIRTDIPPTKESYTYRQWDRVGMAKYIANWSDDLPRVDAFAKEYTSKFRPIGDAYGYNFDEIQKSRADGTNLDEKRAEAARLAIEQKIEESFADGSTAYGIQGFISQPNATVYTVANGASSATAWTTKTGPEILADLNGIATAVASATKQIHPPDTIVLPLRRYNLAITKIMGDGDTRSVLQTFLAMSPYIKNVVPWWKLEGAGGSGTDRMICFKRSPDVLEGIVPREFTQLPAQARNLEFVVNCIAMTGGIVIYRPLAVAYGDGI